jgi:MoaA/NifB/PqqE/SkfB family radical SAM enzyme
MMMKKKIRVLIWGAGNMGEKVYKKFLNSGDIEVVAFGDNSVSKIGTIYCDLPVVSVDNVVENQQNIDFIIISTFDYEPIYKQLTEVISIPIYCNYGAFYMEILSFRCSIDITGWCNAKCKYCYTGRKNRLGISTEKTYMTYESLVKTHQHLVETGILYNFNEVMLYSWGEPLLNPDYLRIIEYLSEQGQNYSLSTNASVVKLTNNPIAYKNCSTVIFSLSGMTQESYGKIHGFDLEIIKRNIKELIGNMRMHGFKGDAKLSFHEYKFNKDEVEKAREFAEGLGLIFEPIKAYLASWSLQNDFLNQCVPSEFLKDMKKELYIENIYKTIDERPNDYRCPLENILSIDDKGFIELCCCCDKDAKDFLWKNVLCLENVNAWRTYRKGMLNCSTCVECRTKGIDYWICNPEQYNNT